MTIIEPTTPPPNWVSGDWMQTFTGTKFFPMSPTPDQVNILDIAHSLAMQCRYNGHVHRFYSVAEHCVLMSWAVPAHLALEALLHDATEAYVGDMVRPLKKSMPEYVLAEERVAIAIGARYGVRPSSNMTPEVKDADNRILLAEKSALFPDQPGAWAVDVLEPLEVTIQAWGPERAERAYLARFEELTA